MSLCCSSIPYDGVHAFAPLCVAGTNGRVILCLCACHVPFLTLPVIRHPYVAAGWRSCPSQEEENGGNGAGAMGRDFDPH